MFCERAVSLVPVGVSVPTATAGLYIWRGAGAAGLKEPSYTGKNRRCWMYWGAVLCCRFRVAGGVSVML